jgi:hypothetical protein
LVVDGAAKVEKTNSNFSFKNRLGLIYFLIYKSMLEDLTRMVLNFLGNRLRKLCRKAQVRVLLLSLYTKKVLKQRGKNQKYVLMQNHYIGIKLSMHQFCTKTNIFSLGLFSLKKKNSFVGQLLL